MMEMAVPRTPLVGSELAGLARTMAPCGCLLDARLIRPNDAQHLTAAEAASIGLTNAQVLRASGAGRALARDLLAALGHGGAEILRATDGAPVWPAGILGSISHDSQYVTAIVARRGAYAGIGIDVEPLEPVDDELAELIASPAERAAFAVEPYGLNLLFAIKEAAFKAAFPVDRLFLDFSELAVDRARGFVHTNYGRTIHCRAISAPRAIAVAWF